MAADPAPCETLADEPACDAPRCGWTGKACVPKACADRGAQCPACDRHADEKACGAAADCAWWAPHGECISAPSSKGRTAGLWIGLLGTLAMCFAAGAMLAGQEAPGGGKVSTLVVAGVVALIGTAVAVDYETDAPAGDAVAVYVATAATVVALVFAGRLRHLWSQRHELESADAFVMPAVIACASALVAWCSFAYAIANPGPVVPSRAFYRHRSIRKKRPSNAVWAAMFSAVALFAAAPGYYFGTRICQRGKDECGEFGEAFWWWAVPFHVAGAALAGYAAHASENDPLALSGAVGATAGVVPFALLAVLLVWLVARWRGDSVDDYEASYGFIPVLMTASAGGLLSAYVDKAWEWDEDKALGE